MFGQGVPQGIGMGEDKAHLSPVNYPAEPVSKKEMYRKRKEEHRRSFDARQPFECGLLLPKQMPLVYDPLEDGNWKENPSGRVIPHERLQQYLTKYRFI